MKDKGLRAFASSLSTQAFVLGMAPKTCNGGIAESGMFYLEH